MRFSMPGWVEWLVEALNFTFYLPPFNVAVFGIQIPGCGKGEWLTWTLYAGNWVEHTIDWVVTVLNITYEWATDAYDLAQGAWDKALELGEKTLQTVYDFSTNTYQTIAQEITNVYQAVTNEVTNVYQTLQEVTQVVNATVVGVAEDFVYTVVEAAVGPLVALLDSVIAFKDSAAEFFSDVPSWLQLHVIEPWFGSFAVGLKRGIEEDDKGFQQWKADVDRKIDSEKGPWHV